MREKIIHKLGAFILAAVMLFGVGILGSSTAQARWHGRRGFAPRVYVGPGPYYRHWHRRHGLYFRW